MGNMSYCRFENTFNDLEDCYHALHDVKRVQDLVDDSNEYERPFIKRLVGMCADIVEEFGDEVSELKE
jgi:hypothetical protein